MSTVRVDGANVRYREEAGPPGAPVMVLLHMAGGGSSVWGPVASRLGRSWRVVAPDFPGHGQSAPWGPEAPRVGGGGGVSAGVAAMAGWVGRLVEVLGVTRPVVAGHSMGGAVALAYVLSSAERVAGLGLVGTAADLALPAGFRELVERRYEEFVSHFTGMALPRGTPAARVGSHQPIFPQADKETVQGDFRAVHGFNVVDRLGEVRVPTVVVGGEADVLTPPRASRLLAAGIPGARLVMVPAAGHLLPREDARAVAEALNGLRPPTA